MFYYARYLPASRAAAHALVDQQHLQDPDVAWHASPLACGSTPTNIQNIFTRRRCKTAERQANQVNEII